MAFASLPVPSGPADALMTVRRRSFLIRDLVCNARHVTPRPGRSFPRLESLPPIRTLATGEGAFAADVSIIIKTLILYTIMVTGSIWEKVVFGKWLFADSFFWEDVFSMLVLALHTAYLVMLFGAIGSVEQRLAVALAAYAAYVINAGQFLWKLRMARLQGAHPEAVPA